MKKRGDDTRIALEEALGVLHSLHRLAMNELTEGGSVDWSTVPMAVGVNSKINCAIEQLESALFILDGSKKIGIRV